MIVLVTQMKKKRVFMWWYATCGSSSLPSRSLWLRFGWRRRWWTIV